MSAATPAVDSMHRLRAVDVMDRPAAQTIGHQTLAAAAEEIRAEARSRFSEFVLNRVNPGSPVRNRAGLPMQHHLFGAAGELGLLPFALPIEVGGAGRSKFDWGIVVAEIARICSDPGFPVLLDITVENTELIMSSGRPELIDRYVADLVAGRRFAVQAAYENRDPYDYQTTARSESGEWVLNGAKRFVAGAVFADLFIVYLRDELSNDILAFLVERDDPGVAPVRLETMGLRSLGFGQVLLHNVRLPEWRMVWRSDALSELNTYARGRRMMTACGVLGAVEGIVEACVESLTGRRRGGRRVLDYPNVERSVGEMRVLLETARSVIYRALDNTRAPGRDPYFDELATTAKHQVSECALRVGQLVMNLQGGESYMSVFGWERFMRDMLGLIGGQGSQELLLIQLGQRSIVGLESRQLREEAAHRTVARLTDAWWTLSALDVNERMANWPELAGAVSDVVTASGVDPRLDVPTRRQLTGLLDSAYALLDAGCPLPQVSVPRAFDGRLAKFAADATAFVACVAAVRTGLLKALLRPGTNQEAAARAAIPEGYAEQLLQHLLRAQLIRAEDDGRFMTDPGLERSVVGGPLVSAFASRLNGVVAATAQLRLGIDRTTAAVCLPGHGDDAPVLVDALVSALLGRLEGLDELIHQPAARVGCAVGDAGRSAAALSAHLPLTTVLTLEPDDVAAERALMAQPRGGGPIQARIGTVTEFSATDRLALVWLPTAGLSAGTLSDAIDAAAAALVPGGWILLAAPCLADRKLRASTGRLGLALSGGALASSGELLQLLRRAGLSHVRGIWEDTAFGIQLIAGRRP